MKNRILKGFLSIALALSFTGCASSSQEGSNEASNDVSKNEKIVEEIKEKGVLTVGCKSDVPGLGYYNEETNEWEGLEIEMAYKVAAQIFDVTELEAKEKNLVQIEKVTVANREEKLENGDIDVLLATYTITKERAKKFALSSSYYTDYVGLMVKDHHADKDSLGSGDIKSIADLDGKRIGVAKNSTTRKDMLNYIDTMNTMRTSPIFCEYASYPALYKALQKGDIDVISVDVSILNGYLDYSTKILNDRFASQHYGAAVTLENADLIEYINKVIE